MFTFRVGYTLLLFNHFQANIVDGFEQALSWENARNKCNASNQIVSPLKSITKNLETYYYRKVKTVWTSNYGLHLGCNKETGFCLHLRIEQVQKNESHQGICHAQDLSVIQITTYNSFKRACENSNLVDVIDMATLGNALNKMDINTTYWIHSINIDTHGFILLCELFTKVPNRTDKNEFIISSNVCKRKQQFKCSRGDNYGTVISKIQVSNNTDPSLIPLWKTNKSGVNSDEVECIPKGDLVWKVSSLTLSGGIILIGLLVTCLRIMRTFGRLKKEKRQVSERRLRESVYDDDWVQMKQTASLKYDTAVLPSGSALSANIQDTRTSRK